MDLQELIMSIENMLEFPAILDPEACEQIIEDTRPKLTPAKVGRGIARMVHPCRVADNKKYVIDTDWSLTLRKFVCDITDTNNLDLVEPVEVVRYPTGGFYYRHNDSNLGDRPYTLSIALNNNFEGGELFFDQIGALIENRPVGSGILWENKQNMTHECRPIREGEKWIINIWVHVWGAEERKNSGEDPLGEDEPQDFTDSPIIIPGEND
jgi:hypothetical protein